MVVKSVYYSGIIKTDSKNGIDVVVTSTNTNNINNIIVKNSDFFVIPNI